ncbi:MAG: hypothetical protein ACR2FM_04625 [Candidatus Saccharimonadales bacterium]
MVCIYCDSKTKTAVVNSRASASAQTTWRRRNCKHCTGVFTTREHIELETALRVQSATNGLQPFLRDRLFLDVYNSVSHRKTALSDSTKLTDTIIGALISLHTGGILSTALIITTTRATLKRFDPAAGVYYAAHHSNH